MLTFFIINHYIFVCIEVCRIKENNNISNQQFTQILTLMNTITLIHLPNQTSFRKSQNVKNLNF